ncbi:MAG: radical SAM protein [Deltaproteobacteria bacterium]|nr:radical SAM protein [Deltaproteobacteria bacterium]
MHLPKISDLTLVLTERCNMNCAFCYVPKQARSMPVDLALEAVDWLVDQAPKGSQPSIGFFGGEPLLAADLLNKVVAHGRKRRGDDIRFTMPTNGTLVDREAADALERGGVELALSVDDATVSAKGGEQHTLAGVEENLEQLRRFAPTVRVTVTPDNVENLFETIIRIYQAGFQKIMHQPALEVAWPQEALETWRAQHEALADWSCERLARGEAIPELVVLEGIIARLGGQAQGYCGAGVRMGAVDPEGRVFACYRSVYDPQADRLVLGHLREGWVNEPLIAAYAKLHPHRAKPEEGSCQTCPARDGCTAYCPAMGHALLGDLRAVPANACHLMKIQVEICRDLDRRVRQIQRRRRRRVGSRVAAAALALGLADGSLGCDSRTPASTSDAALIDGAHLDKNPNFEGPGVCAVYLEPPPDFTPGLCARPHIFIPDSPAVKDSRVTPGLCPVPAPDAALVLSAHAI